MNWWNLFERSELTVQLCCTYVRVHRRSSTSTYPRKRYATMRAVRRYIHTYFPYHLQQRNNELMKFIRAKRLSNCYIPNSKFVCSTNLGFSGGRTAIWYQVRIYQVLCTSIWYQVRIYQVRTRYVKKSPTGSLPPAVPLAITRTFRPWTHTSDDSYIYQLSLVVAIFFCISLSFIFSSFSVSG